MGSRRRSRGKTATGRIGKGTGSKRESDCGKGKLRREAMVMAEAAQGTDAVVGKGTEPVRVIVWYDYI